MTPAITNNRQPLTKDPGSLTHILRSQNSPEASGSDGVHVRQYILLGGETDQNKYLLIRFINASDRVVNGLMFTVDQLDGNGSVLASSECAFRGFHSRRDSCIRRRGRCSCLPTVRMCVSGSPLMTAVFTDTPSQKTA